MKPKLRAEGVMQESRQEETVSSYLSFGFTVKSTILKMLKNVQREHTSKFHLAHL